jgi:hypothetical protein
MKKALLVIAALVMFASLSFGQQVYDNLSVESHRASAYFELDVYRALSISASSNIDLGVLVVSSTPYPMPSDKVITFTVTGEGGAKILLDETAVISPAGIATFTGSWGTEPTKLSGTLDYSASGSATYTYTLGTVTAVAPGTAKITCTVDVGYSL